MKQKWVILYISRSIETSPSFSASRADLAKHYGHLLDQLGQEFAQVHETLSGIFSGQGARIIPMTDADHYRHCSSFLNPSLAERFNYDALDAFDPALSIQENCWHGEGNGQADFGFWTDGHYHSIIVLTRWPKMTFPGIIHRLTNLRLLDYTITVNVDPIPIRKEIIREEKAHERIAGDYASEKKLSLLTVMQKKERKIAAFMQGIYSSDAPLGLPSRRPEHSKAEKSLPDCLYRNGQPDSDFFSHAIARWDRQPHLLDLSF